MALRSVTHTSGLSRQTWAGLLICEEWALTLSMCASEALLSAATDAAWPRTTTPFLPKYMSPFTEQGKPGGSLNCSSRMTRERDA